MAYTHFKFTKLGERTTTKVDGALAVINQWYLKDLPITYEKNNPGHYGQPFDQLKYKTTDGTIEGNEANINIDCPPNLSIDPESNNFSLDIGNNETHNFMDTVTVNSAVDRIKIVSFTANGVVTFNGSNIYPNFVMMMYDFALLAFTSGSGTGSPYQTISFQVGNSLGYNATIYTMTYNINPDGLAILDLINEIEEDDLIHKRYRAHIKIKNGIPLGTASVELTIDCAVWGHPSTEFVTNGSGFGSVSRTGNDVILLTANLNSSGEMSIYAWMDVADIDSPFSGTITYELKNINGNTTFVSGINNAVELNIDL